MGSEKQETGKSVVERLWTGDFVKLNIGNFMLFTSFYLLMPLLPIYLSETFGAGKHTIGAVLSGYTVMALIARPIAGYIVDSYNRRKVLILVYTLFAALFAGYMMVGTILAFAVLRTLHGGPFGATTVANSTSAIDSLLPTRRAEGIGYYGLSNNLAMATAPSLAIWIYHATGSFDILFATSFGIALVGLTVVCTAKQANRPPKSDRHISLDRFFLVDGWREAVVMMALSSSYGVLSTYIAIYSQQELGMTESSGTWFMLLAVGLMVSRLIGGRTLRQGKAKENAQWGMTLSMIGYFVFAMSSGGVSYYASALIIGLGNGHMFPGMQTLFINMTTPSRRGTANATQLTAWDAGIGLGVVLGGALAETFGYGPAFWTAAIIDTAGVAYFWVAVRNRKTKTKA